MWLTGTFPCCEAGNALLWLQTQIPHWQTQIPENPVQDCHCREGGSRKGPFTNSQEEEGPWADFTAFIQSSFPSVGCCRKKLHKESSTPYFSWAHSFLPRHRTGLPQNQVLSLAPIWPALHQGFLCHHVCKCRTGRTRPPVAVKHFTQNIRHKLDIFSIIQTCWQRLHFYHDGCMVGCVVQTFLSNPLAKSTNPSASNLMLTLIQGYLYIMAFLTSVALQLPTSFNHIIEMMKWSLLYLFHDAIMVTAQCKYLMLVGLWKVTCEHQAAARLQPKSSFVAIPTLNDKCTKPWMRCTAHSAQLKAQSSAIAFQCWQPGDNAA